MKVDRRTAIKSGLAAGVLGLSGISTRAAEGSETDAKGSTKEYIEKDQLKFWLETSMNRVYPNTAPGGLKKLSLIAAKNERISFQACVRNLSTDSAIVKCEVIDGGPFQTTVRRVGFVPVMQLNTYTPKEDLEGIGYIPGLCPDPLYPEQQTHVGPESNGIFWMTVNIPEHLEAGKHTFSVKLTLENRYGYVGYTNPEAVSVSFPVEIDVKSLVIKPRENFPVTNWISIDSIWRYYEIEPCGQRFWELADKYIENLVTHGNNVMYTPIWNIRHELLSQPAQLLKVKKVGNDYEFDFSDVRKWVRLALGHGAEHIEWPHFFTPAPESGKHPQRIYERAEGAVGEILWPPDTAATSDVYVNFLKQFIPEFKAFLEEEDILHKSFFHCADEPDGEQQIGDYKRARALLQEFAPWMTVMDALSDTTYAVEKVVDNPIPSIETALNFKAAGLDTWVYFCCGPRQDFLQRLQDTPLPKIRMNGFLFYKLEATGFLHWGYCYWYKFCTDEMANPFIFDNVNGAWPGCPFGDTHVVYPGENGPLDSIRWEIFAEGLQDYALLQSAGIKRDDPLLSEITDYAHFPKTEEWMKETRRKILAKF